MPSGRARGGGQPLREGRGREAGAGAAFPSLSPQRPFCLWSPAPLLRTCPSPASRRAGRPRPLRGAENRPHRGGPRLPSLSPFPLLTRRAPAPAAARSSILPLSPPRRQSRHGNGRRRAALGGAFPRSGG